MPILQSEKREAFAQALARGTKIKTAYAKAGYADNRNGKGISKMKDIVRRVAEIKLEMAGSGSPDLAPLLDVAVCAFNLCLELKSGAGMAAARDFFVEMVRIKREARHELTGPVTLDPLPSIEEWAKANGIS